ncbi:MAG: nickel-dependent hydrogenase large subunit [Burkholderiales bacterium]|nr:nickel-dependent hydrogenase large subunit [Burkholderiales bacterium]
MTRLIVGPFNRVEGDLEVQLDIADGQVRTAHVVAPMYRGFEPMLQGRDPMDALVIVPRICGICSVSQSVAAARALADAMGLAPPPNGRLATHLMLACENLADHLSHFYLFFMPDFTRAVYADRPWHAEARRRFDPQEGAHHREALAARQRWFTLIGTLGGRWPHTHALQPGGSTRAVEAAERLRLLAKLREMRDFVETTLLGAPIESLLGLQTANDLQAWVDAAPQRGDLRFFLAIANDLGLHALGRGAARLMSYGAYPSEDGQHAFARGVWHQASGQVDRLDTTQIREDLHHTRLAEQGAPRHPREGHTQPEPDKPGAYTWNKAPRLAGHVVETGAIARQVVDGQPLVRALVQQHGSTVATRVLARVLEVARLLELMTQWLRALQDDAPYCHTAALSPVAQGEGLTEAARGALGHWVSLRDGRIANYQIIAPTSWNFSPRDAAGTPGALEAALVGAPLRPGETTPVAVQHIVRSFDPCMVCTVH